MKNKFTIYKIISSSTLLIMLASCDGISSRARSANVNAAGTQVERLARPAINEGLVLSNSNLNAFNSIPPSLDLRSDISAVNAVLTEAAAVLTVVNSLGTNAGLTPPAVGDVVSQFLPDVMRISVDDTHYGALHALNANSDRTSNSRQNEVAYTACVSLTSGAPLLCGGRKIRDDVIDITLSYLAGGASFAAPEAGTPANVPTYAVSDAISYSTTHTASAPLLASFPFLAAPQ